MAKFSLHAHPDYPPRLVRAVSVEMEADAHEATIGFQIDSVEHVALPQPASPDRTDDLWRTSCFEMFLRPLGGSAYVEFNFSPSGQWAAYDFDDRRAGMRDAPVTVAPHIERDDGRWLIDVDFSDLSSASAAIGLTAVIEEHDGTKSYWALAHAPGPPDFHNPATFIATLPPPR